MVVGCYWDACYVWANLTSLMVFAFLFFFGGGRRATGTVSGLKYYKRRRKEGRKEDKVAR